MDGACSSDLPAQCPMRDAGRIEPGGLLHGARGRQPFPLRDLECRLCPQRVAARTGAAGRSRQVRQRAEPAAGAARGPVPGRTLSASVREAASCCRTWPRRNARATRKRIIALRVSARGWRAIPAAAPGAARRIAGRAAIVLSVGPPRQAAARAAMELSARGATFLDRLRSFRLSCSSIHFDSSRRFFFFFQFGLAQRAAVVRVVAGLQALGY